MLIAYEVGTLNTIFVHPTATEMTDDLLGLIGGRDYGFIVVAISYEEFSKPGSSYRLEEVDGVVSFEFTPAPAPDPPKTPEQAKIEELLARVANLELAIAAIGTGGVL